VEADRSSECQLNFKANFALKAVDSSRQGAGSESKAQHKAAWVRSYEIEISANWRYKGLRGLVGRYRRKQVAEISVIRHFGLHQL